MVFSRANTGAGFAFDPAASNIASAFVDKIFAFDSMDESDFVGFAYERLMTIAESPADPRRAWLRRFLRDAPPSAKVKALKAQMTGTK